MTREEELHIAEQIKDYLCTGNPIWDVDMIAEAMDAAIEALKFRGAYEIAVKAANKAFENRWTQWVEWIPCSERLPDDIKPVIVTWKNTDPKSYYQYIAGKHYTGVACYKSGRWYWYSSTTEDILAEYGRCDFEEFDEAIECIAWMPLPSPYIYPTTQEGEHE